MTIDLMKEYNLREPEFIDMEVAFRINLHRSRIDANDAISANDGIKLGVDGDRNGVKVTLNRELEQVQRLLKIIENNLEATQAHYATELGVSKRTISQMFASLQGKGVLEQQGTK